MIQELRQLLEQLTKQKESAWAEVCKLENELNITSGYTHDWTLGKHASFSFAERELAKIIGASERQPDVSINEAIQPENKIGKSNWMLTSCS